MVSEYGPLIPPELRRPPFVPRLHADELLARERIFNWRIMSKHMPYENYIRRAHDLAPWEMFLEFMAIDVVDQLTGRDGIKNWYLHPVPDFEDPQIQPLHGRWVRAFTFSEHVARSNEIQLTGDWLVRAEVRSYSYETLLNFDVRRHAGLGTVYYLAGLQRLMNPNDWWYFYKVEGRAAQQANGLVPSVLPAREKIPHRVMDDHARCLFPVCPDCERGRVSYQEQTRAADIFPSEFSLQDEWVTWE